MARRRVRSLRAREWTGFGRGPAQRFTMARVEESEFQESQFSHDADPDALSAAPGRVASIVGAAERAAADLREQAETRSRERIAEADRAADNRVLAAEEEAEDILGTARAQAEATTNEAVDT